MAERTPPKEFVIPWEEATVARKPATVHVRLRGLGAAGAKPVDIDPKSVSAIETIRDAAGRAYLDIKAVQPMPDGTGVQFDVLPRDWLLREKGFSKLVRDPVEVTVKGAAKAEKATGTRKPAQSKCLIRIESRLRVCWEARLDDGSGQVFSGPHHPQPPVELDPNGQSGFLLVTWVEEWLDGLDMWLLAEKDYDFSHWLAPDDRTINLDVLAPSPRPWAAEWGDDPQDMQPWQSQVLLPSPRFPALKEYPIDTVIRVRAWNRGDITRRQEYAVLHRPGTEHVAETDVPIRLMPAYDLAVKFVPETGRQYRGTTFSDPKEFFADGFDKLIFRVAAQRRGAPDDQVNEDAQLKVTLKPDGSTDYELKTEPVGAKPSPLRGSLRSAGDCGSDGADPPLVALHVEGQYQLPNGETVTLDPLDVDLKPRNRPLKLNWSVEPPALRQGDRLVVPADGKTAFDLSTWLEVTDNGRQRRDDPNDYDFAIWVEPTNYPTDIVQWDEPRVDGDHVTVHGCSTTALPDPNHPDVALSLSVRVAAWRTPPP